MEWNAYNTNTFLPPNIQAVIAEQQAIAAQQQAAQAPGVGSGLGELAGSGAGLWGMSELMGGTGAADAAGGVLMSPSGSAVASAAPWATEGALLNPATSEAVATMAPTASAATAASPWAMGGFGTAGNAYAPLLGAALAGDVLINKRHGGRGAAQGALAGAGMGSYFGPYGALAGALIGGGVGYFGNFGDENRFQTEYNRSQALRDKGINWDLNTDKPSQGRSIGDLIAEAEANKAAGKWGNVQFAGSRNEKDLKPEDIWGYSAFGEKYGNDWLKKYSEEQRRQIAQKALDSGAVRESTGSIDINFTPELDAAVQAILTPLKEEKKK